MIQDIFPHRFNNQYIVRPNIAETDFVLHYQENSLLIKNNGTDFSLPQKQDLPCLTDQTAFVFLFSLNNVPCFLIWDTPKFDDSRFIYQEINFFRTIKQAEIAWVSIAGFHLRNWYSATKFCGECGASMQHKTDERAMICPECQTTVYPKISPAIIVAIIRGDQLLLARNSNFPGSWYSLVAGYADVGETLEETVMREVKEEVGLDVKHIRYYKSQPWPFSGSMMIGFIAEADPDQPIVVDQIEIAEAEWFRRGNLPDHPSTLSIAGEMIEKFERGEL
ncbi:MAG: NAD(+) diphosphatase [Prolixibacteraceae bacterium]